MSIRVSSRPLSTYLLRIAEVRTETISVGFELVELRTGAVQRFASLGGLRRFLAGQPKASAGARSRRRK